MDVEGAYNVGGIVGNMEGSTVQYAENSGTVTAIGYDDDGNYTFHTDYTGNGYSTDGSKTVAVNVANAGGIAGTSSADSTITDVLNTGDVSSSKGTNNDYYDAGNVGGIVGSAVDTNITNATNRENEVRGAHNVGGVAGYFGNSNDNNDIKYTINRGINDGGDVMATGARNSNSFVTEIIRPVNKNQTEEFIIGNIGGIAGYMDGDNVYITGSGNRGTVHTDEPADPANVEKWQKAANVGGVVGKIDRSNTKQLNDENNIVDAYGNLAQAAVSDSYNTGDVLGYTGIGGIAGLMYNGEIASSYNLGYLRSTRQSHVGPATGTTEVVDALNMGGIVGDTTEESNAKALLYDVYNKGQIGDKEFNYFGRHVGGVVGRLSGTVEKAYNTGAIYNGYNVVGGIAGWVAAGTIQNAFNTGNITVYNQNESTSQVGGIAGAANGGGNVLINNVYNLGTLRSFDIGCGKNAVAGILGTASGTGTVTIKNAYTTGNLYSGVKGSDNSFVEDMYSIDADSGINIKVSSMYASTEWDANVDASHNTYYIKPDIVNNKPLFAVVKNDTASQAVEFANKSIYAYNFDGGITKPNGGDVDENSDWRIYAGNTPILNAFLPNAEDYFDDKTLSDEGIGSIQYGTAYDPLLTIIKANGTKTDLSYNWSDLGINNAAGIAVYGAGLTLSGFKATSGTGYFGGTVYADGALTLNGGTNDIGLGSAANIYGSAVNINTDGKVTIYGNVTATGNTTNDVDNSEMKVEDAGNITINAGDVDVYGTLTSATTADYGNDVKIPGIEGTAVTWNPGNVSDPYAEMSDIADRFAHTTGKSNVNGNITINAGKDEYGNAIGGGNVNIYFGNQEQGLITTGGDLQVEATGNIFVDSDLDVGGNLKLTSTGKNSEILLTLTNIGKVQADKFTGVIENFLNGKNIDDINASDLLKVIQKAYPGVEFTDAYAKRIVAALTKYEESGNKASAIEQLNNDIAVAYMHQFMHNFDENVEGSNKIYLNADSGNAKLTVDMWDYNHNKYDFKKYDTKFDEHGTEHTFKDELDNLDLLVNNDTAEVHAKASEYVYVEVSNGAQLKGIQDAGKANNAALGYNYALMGDINASDVENYVAIGGADGAFTGTFDGRGNRIIGLKVDNNNVNAGIFSTVGNGGVVKNVNIYSGNFTGTTTAGAVAGMNEGRIENIVTFGNTVTANSNAGGIVGVNSSGEFSVTNEETKSTNGGVLENGIYDVESTGSVIAGSNTAIAGGLVGTNEGGLANSFSDSAVSVKVDNQKPITTTGGLGGVVGVNKGDVQMVDSLGVTNGGTTGSSNVGGIIGINNGNMYSGYNESIVSGKDNVGGIIGANSSKVANVVNATSVTGKDKDKDNVSEYVGGLIGSNNGDVNNGRNNGTITGTKYVGGMVGNNAAGSILTNLVNDSSAAITGVQYVGGIAGNNAGKITANNSNLINRGSITGNQYVGGVAGMNTGEISNTVNSVVLNATGTDAKYFGGVAGYNNGVIGTVTNTSVIDVTAQDGTLVGGIIGYNAGKGTLEGEIVNEGNISGESEVGGIIGENINKNILNNKNKPRLTISNKGNVKAEAGGAAGIFYDNESVIDNVDLVNEGTVTGGTAKDSVTGGLFGKNSGKVTNSTLTNSGIVTGGGTVGGLIGNNSGSASGSVFTNDGKVEGENKVGGLFGINSGSFNTSSLINTVNAQVTGKQEVGGLIGVNSGDITGGRLEANGTDNGYYKYQIYNNGTITVTGKGENIGGLIGSNTGSLTAGYNTGAIKVENSSNVGGIVGNNEGIVDQVFNTVYNTDGTKGAITGGNNVGGLVGTNSGMLSNAYNTTDVFGNSVFGNAVGNNTAKGTIKNIYASNNSGKLIGENINQSVDAIQNAYSFVNGDTSATKIISGEDQKDSGSYDGFDFSATDVDGDAADWKNYDGYSNPLLKVFLTKAKYTGNESFTYNGQDQGLTINGNVSAADKLDAYNNANSLLQATQNKNAGQDYLGIYSQQIAASGKGDAFDPNNLGYDIDVTYDIKKAQINISLDEINRVYGNATISNNTQNSIKNEFGYGFTYEIENINDTMREELVNNGIVFEQTYDGAVYGVSGNKVTNDAGDYTWSADFVLNNDNYEFTNGKQEITIDGAMSTVKQAEITVDLNEVIRDYGNTAIKNNGGNYTASINGLVNGDNELGYTSNDLNITVTSDGALTGNSSGKVTGDAGDHIWTAEVTGKDGQTLTNLSKNYNITVKDSGKSTVNKAQITIGANNEEIHLGETPDYTGTNINGALVNGDKLNGNYQYGVKDSADENVVGEHSIGVWIGNTFYDLSATVDWTKVEGFFSNYEVTYKPGTLTVTEQVMPDLPDNWPNNRWDYLFADNPFDRNENFRERKAEVNFVDGAMEI